MPQITYFEDSPDVGPHCLCSLCGKPILEPEMPIRVFDRGLEARFHIACWNEAAPLGERITSVHFHTEDREADFEIP